MSASVKFEVETTYINTFVQDGGYGLSWTVRAGEQMRACGVDLVDVNQVLRSGRVFESDYVDGVGGLWSVFGKTTENLGLNVSVTVVSSEYRVKVVFVEKAAGKQK